MARIKLLADIDGVACDHAKAICEWVELNYSMEVNPSSVLTWDHNFGPLSFVEAVDICYKKYNFVCSMPVNQDFLNFYKKVIDRIDITFATARKDCTEATEEWLSMHFPGAKVLFTPQKVLIPQQDFLIDDNYKECILCAENGMKSILLQRPWNCSQQIHNVISKYDNIIYCHSFEGLPDIFWNSF